MPMTLDEQTYPGIVALHASGTLEKADFDRTKPELDRVAKTSGPVRLLCNLDDFQGWTPGGFWADIKFDLTHRDAFAAIAIVGEKRWEAWLTTAAKPMFKAPMRFFPRERMDEAVAWLRSV